MEEVKHKSFFLENLKKFVSKLSPALKCMTNNIEDDEPNMDDAQVKTFFETAEKIDKKYEEAVKSEKARYIMQQVKVTQTRNTKSEMNTRENKKMLDREHN